LDFSEEVAPTRCKKKKMSSDMRSVPDLKTRETVGMFAVYSGNVVQGHSRSSVTFAQPPHMD